MVHLERDRKTSFLEDGGLILLIHLHHDLRLGVAGN